MKNIFGKAVLVASVLLLSMTGISCSNEEKATPQKEKTYDMTGFAKGADVSWVTEMEAAGYKFYNASGAEQECMSLMRDLGMNAIRLRVWVDPTEGWCNKQDVLIKAWRAHNLGMRLMIDFHYSDSWADPGQQEIPAAWADYDLEQMKTAVANHTKEVLQLLKDNGIDVEWVQIGNETRTGMLKPIGAINNNDFSNFAALVDAGYDAAKSVYENALCVIHIDQGDNKTRLKWMFNGLKSKNAKYDVIGVSLYPTDDDWEAKTDSCMKNLKTMAETYQKKVMVCEIGMDNTSKNAEAMLNKMVKGCKAIDSCLGIFYWEPECYNGWEGYTMGAFDTTGKPNSSLNAFSSATE